MKVWILLLVSLAFVGGLKLKPLHKARKAADKVEGSYLVSIKDGVSEEVKADLIRALVSKDANASESDFHATVNDWLTDIMNGFVGHLSEEALEYIRSSPIVDYVEEDQFVKGSGEVLDFSLEPPNEFWGLDRLDQENLPLDKKFQRPCGNLTGRGVNVYVMDSGIMYGHTEFSGSRAKYPGCDPISQVSSLTSPSRGEDCHGHGTHVAGIAGGRTISASPGVTLYSVRVLGCDNIGRVSALMEGFQCILRHRRHNGKMPSVINFSINAFKSASLTSVIARLTRWGIHIVTVAGNSQLGPRDACEVSSGDVQNAIMVSASDDTDHVYSNSNLGKCIDVFAPGVSIVSAQQFPFAFFNNFYTVQTGTSMAAPRVASAVALILEKCPHLHPRALRRLLLKHFTTPRKIQFSNILRSDVFQLVPKSEVVKLVRKTPRNLLYMQNFCTQSFEDVFSKLNCTVV